MTAKEIIKTSKFLSLILRHEPERVGLALGEAGWVAVEELLRARGIRLKWICNMRRRLHLNCCITGRHRGSLIRFARMGCSEWAVITCIFRRRQASRCRSAPGTESRCCLQFTPERCIGPLMFFTVRQTVFGWWNMFRWHSLIFRKEMVLTEEKVKYVHARSRLSAQSV